MNAMGGDVTFRKALQDRLNLIRQSQTQIRDFLDQNPPSLTSKIQVRRMLLEREGRTDLLITWATNNPHYFNFDNLHFSSLYNSLNVMYSEH